MKRSFLACSAAAVCLLAGSVAAIFWATEEDERPGPVNDSATAQAPPRPSTIGVTARGEPILAPPVPTPASANVEPELEPALFEQDGLAHAPTGTPSRAAHGVRRAFRQELENGLMALQKHVASCSAAQSAFTLQLEAVQGGIRIVEATPEGTEQSNQAAVSCARKKLQGYVIKAPSVQPGRHWEIPFVVRS